MQIIYSGGKVCIHIFQVALQIFARDLEQVANSLCAQENSASYP